MPCRDLNAATSQEVFAGPYLDDPIEKEKFSSAFMDMTQGFLAFPLCIPGTAVWRGKQGRLYIIALLKSAAARSKANMQVLPLNPIPPAVLGTGAALDTNEQPISQYHCRRMRMSGLG